MATNGRTYIVYYIDEHLCVVHREVVDHFAFAVAGEDRVDNQEREFL